MHDLARRLIGFESHYNGAARPFDWRFNRNDGNRLLTRIAALPPDEVGA